MAFVICTPSGRYVIDDPEAVTLAFSWNENVVRSQALVNNMVKALIDSHSERLSGYDYLYEEDLPPIVSHQDFPLPAALDGLRTRHIYFARRGMYHFKAYL